MDNRPARIKKNIIAFRDSPWDAKFNFPSGYDKTNLTAYLKVSRQLLDVEVGSSISGNRFIPSLTAEQVSYLPSAIDLYIADNGVAIIAGTINVRMGGDDDDDGDDGNEFEVQIGGDEIVVVEILGMDLIAGQVEVATAQAVIATTQAGIATDKSEEASGFASQAEQYSAAAADFSISASASKTAAEEARDIANDAKTGAEAARDEALTAKRTRVATFAAMKGLCVDDKPRDFTVITDEFQDDTNVPYVWDGAILFEYNGFDICEQQP